MRRFATLLALALIALLLNSSTGEARSLSGGSQQWLGHMASTHADEAGEGGIWAPEPAKPRAMATGGSADFVSLQLEACETETQALQAALARLRARRPAADGAREVLAELTRMQRMLSESRADKERVLSHVTAMDALDKQTYLAYIAQLNEAHASVRTALEQNGELRRLIDSGGLGELQELLASPALLQLGADASVHNTLVHGLATSVAPQVAYERRVRALRRLDKTLGGLTAVLSAAAAASSQAGIEQRTDAKKNNAAAAAEVKRLDMELAELRKRRAAARDALADAVREDLSASGQLDALTKRLAALQLRCKVARNRLVGIPVPPASLERARVTLEDASHAVEAATDGPSGEALDEQLAEQDSELAAETDEDGSFAAAAAAAATAAAEEEAEQLGARAAAIAAAQGLETDELDMMLAEARQAMEHEEADELGRRATALKRSGGETALDEAGGEGALDDLLAAEDGPGGEALSADVDVDALAADARREELLSTTSALSDAAAAAKEEAEDDEEAEDAKQVELRRKKLALEDAMRKAEAAIDSEMDAQHASGNSSLTTDAVGVDAADRSKDAHASLELATAAAIRAFHDEIEAAKRSARLAAIDRLRRQLADVLSTANASRTALLARRKQARDVQVQADSARVELAVAQRAANWAARHAPQAAGKTAADAKADAAADADAAAAGAPTAAPQTAETKALADAVTAFHDRAAAAASEQAGVRALALRLEDLLTHAAALEQLLATIKGSPPTAAADKLRDALQADGGLLAMATVELGEARHAHDTQLHDLLASVNEVQRQRGLLAEARLVSRTVAHTAAGSAKHAGIAADALAKRAEAAGDLVARAQRELARLRDLQRGAELGEARSGAQLAVLVDRLQRLHLQQPGLPALARLVAASGPDAILSEADLPRGALPGVPAHRPRHVAALRGLLASLKQLLDRAAALHGLYSSAAAEAAAAGDGAADAWRAAARARAERREVDLGRLLAMTTDCADECTAEERAAAKRAAAEHLAEARSALASRRAAAELEVREAHAALEAAAQATSEQLEADWDLHALAEMPLPEPVPLPTAASGATGMTAGTGPPGEERELALDMALEDMDASTSAHMATALAGGASLEAAESRLALVEQQQAVLEETARRLAGLQDAAETRAAAVSAAERVAHKAKEDAAAAAAHAAAEAVRLQQQRRLLKALEQHAAERAAVAQKLAAIRAASVSAEHAIVSDASEKAAALERRLSELQARQAALEKRLDELTPEQVAAAKSVEDSDAAASRAGRAASLEGRTAAALQEKKVVADHLLSEAAAKAAAAQAAADEAAASAVAARQGAMTADSVAVKAASQVEGLLRAADARAHGIDAALDALVAASGEKVTIMEQRYTEATADAADARAALRDLLAHLHKALPVATVVRGSAHTALRRADALLHGAGTALHHAASVFHAARHADLVEPSPTTEAAYGAAEKEMLHMKLAYERARTLRAHAHARATRADKRVAAVEHELALTHQRLHHVGLARQHVADLLAAARQHHATGVEQAARWLAMQQAAAQAAAALETKGELRETTVAAALAAGKQAARAADPVTAAADAADGDSDDDDSDGASDDGRPHDVLDLPPRDYDGVLDADTIDSVDSALSISGASGPAAPFRDAAHVLSEAEADLAPAWQLARQERDGAAAAHVAAVAAAKAEAEARARRDELAARLADAQKRALETKAAAAQARKAHADDEATVHALRKERESSDAELRVARAAEAVARHQLSAAGATLRTAEERASGEDKIAAEERAEMDSIATLTDAVQADLRSGLSAAEAALEAAQESAVDADWNARVQEAHASDAQTQNELIEAQLGRLRTRLTKVLTQLAHGDGGGSVLADSAADLEADAFKLEEAAARGAGAADAAAHSAAAHLVEDADAAALAAEEHAATLTQLAATAASGAAGMQAEVDADDRDLAVAQGQLEASRHLVTTLAARVSKESESHEYRDAVALAHDAELLERARQQLADAASRAATARAAAQTALAKQQQLERTAQRARAAAAHAEALAGKTSGRAAQLRGRLQDALGNLAGSPGSAPFNATVLRDAADLLAARRAAVHGDDPAGPQAAASAAGDEVLAAAQKVRGEQLRHDKVVAVEQQVAREAGAAVRQFQAAAMSDDRASLADELQRVATTTGRYARAAEAARAASLEAEAVANATRALLQRAQLHMQLVTEAMRLQEEKHVAVKAADACLIVQAARQREYETAAAKLAAAKHELEDAKLSYAAEMTADEAAENLVLKSAASFKRLHRAVKEKEAEVEEAKKKAAEAKEAADKAAAKLAALKAGFGDVQPAKDGSEAAAAGEAADGEEAGGEAPAAAAIHRGTAEASLLALETYVAAPEGEGSEGGDDEDSDVRPATAEEFALWLNGGSSYANSAAEEAWRRAIQDAEAAKSRLRYLEEQTGKNEGVLRKALAKARSAHGDASAAAARAASMCVGVPGHTKKHPLDNFEDWLTDGGEAVVDSALVKKCADARRVAQLAADYSSLASHDVSAMQNETRRLQLQTVRARRALALALKRLEEAEANARRLQRAAAEAALAAQRRQAALDAKLKAQRDAAQAAADAKARAAAAKEAALADMSAEEQQAAALAGASAAAQAAAAAAAEAAAALAAAQAELASLRKKFVRSHAAARAARGVGVEQARSREAAARRLHAAELALPPAQQAHDVAKAALDKQIATCKPLLQTAARAAHAFAVSKDQLAAQGLGGMTLSAIHADASATLQREGPRYEAAVATMRAKRAEVLRSAAEARREVDEALKLRQNAARAATASRPDEQERLDALAHVAGRHGHAAAPPSPPGEARVEETLDALLAARERGRATESLRDAGLTARFRAASPVTHMMTLQGRLTYDRAVAACAQKGAHLCSHSELAAAFVAGYDSCVCGWTATALQDDRQLVELLVQGEKSVCGKRGINVCAMDEPASGRVWGAHCCA